MARAVTLLPMLPFPCLSHLPSFPATPDLPPPCTMDLDASPAIAPVQAPTSARAVKSADLALSTAHRLLLKTFKKQTDRLPVASQVHTQ